MTNRGAGYSAAGKEGTPKGAISPERNAFWGAGEYPAHCRESGETPFAESYPPCGIFCFSRLWAALVPLFSFVSAVSSQITMRFRRKKE